MKILNVNQVVNMTGLSKATIWRMERKETFPKRIKLADRRVGWPEAEVIEWLESRPRGVCMEPIAQN